MSTTLHNHVFVAGPQQPWEILKIGGGTPPVRTDDGWLSLFHGVSGQYVPGVALQPYVHYAAGVMIHATDDVSRVLHRSAQPLLEPQTVDETTVPNVVFPTAIDVRGPRSADVYHGMARQPHRLGEADVVAVARGLSVRRCLAPASILRTDVAPERNDDRYTAVSSTVVTAAMSAALLAIRTS